MEKKSNNQQSPEGIQWRFTIQHRHWIQVSHSRSQLGGALCIVHDQQSLWLEHEMVLDEPEIPGKSIRDRKEGLMHGYHPP